LEDFTPSAVIDTQALLDWQLFRDASTAHWRLPGPDSGWRWVATPAMRVELAHVLARPFCRDRPATPDAVLAFFDRHVQLVEQFEWPPLAGLQCTDRDDQKFVDLACNLRSRWLVSRDKAVLKLRRRAWQAWGVQILPPAQWQREGAALAPSLSVG
jgi:uncharacterized protein